MNKPEFKYYVDEVRFDETNPISFNEEVWRIGYEEDVEPDDPNRLFLIFTDNGTLTPTGFRIIDKGPMVGVEFDTEGEICLSKYGYKEEESTRISRVAVMRQPHNVWVWVYMIDVYGECVATFCGHDELDGLAYFVDDMKKEFDY